MKRMYERVLSLLKKKKKGRLLVHYMATWLLILILILLMPPCNYVQTHAALSPSSKSLVNHVEGKQLLFQDPPIATLKQEEQVLRALEQAGYMTLSTMLQVWNQVQLLPTHDRKGTYTLFAPSDSALSVLNLASPTIFEILQYHIVNCRHSYKDLLRLPLGSRLQTLLPAATLLVTTTKSNRTPNATFSINRVPIVDPDIYLGESIAIHGINHLFNPDAAIVPSQINDSPIFSMTCPASPSTINSTPTMTALRPSAEPSPVASDYDTSPLPAFLPDMPHFPVIPMECCSSNESAGVARSKHLHPHTIQQAAGADLIGSPGLFQASGTAMPPLYGFTIAWLITAEIIIAIAITRDHHSHS